jgi:hypothetical protein
MALANLVQGKWLGLVLLMTTDGEQFRATSGVARAWTSARWGGVGSGRGGGFESGARVQVDGVAGDESVSSKCSRIRAF